MWHKTLLGPIYIPLCLSHPPRPQTMFHFNHPVLTSSFNTWWTHVPWCNLPLSLSSRTHTMFLQPSLTSSPWNMSQKQLGPRGNSGDGDDWGLNECAEKDSLPLFSPLKSCHKYYFKLILTDDPRIYQDLARSRGQRGVLAAPSPPGPSCLQYHSSLCRQDFFFF